MCQDKMAGCVASSVDPGQTTRSDVCISFFSRVCLSGTVIFHGELDCRSPSGRGSRIRLEQNFFSHDRTVFTWIKLSDAIVYFLS